jgi:hypothetical protein
VQREPSQPLLLVDLLLLLPSLPPPPLPSHVPLVDTVWDYLQ